MDNFLRGLSSHSPYDGKWSKSMVGYGAEDGHFVVELTYNYGLKMYKRGNDYQVSNDRVTQAVHVSICA